MVLLLVPIALILIAFVSYATAQMNHAWADAIVRGFTAWIKSIPLVGEAVERLIASGATWIANRIGTVYLNVQSRAVNWIGGLAHYVGYIAALTLAWPIDLMKAMRWLVVAEIPHLLRGLPNAVTKLVHDARKVIGGLERDVARLYAHLPGQVRKLIHGGLIGLVGPFLIPLRWLLSVYRPVSRAAAHAGGIALPWIELPRLRRDAINLRKRLTRVEKLLGVTAMAAVMAKVLQVPSRCLRTGNVGKTARRLCGMDTNLLENLLLDGLAIVGAISVVEFAEGLLAIEDEAVSILSAGIREFPS